MEFQVGKKRRKSLILILNKIWKSEKILNEDLVFSRTWKRKSSRAKATAGQQKSLVARKGGCQTESVPQGM